MKLKEEGKIIKHGLEDQNKEAILEMNEKSHQIIEQIDDLWSTIFPSKPKEIKNK